MSLHIHYMESCSPLFQIPFVGADACGFIPPHNITLSPRRLTHLIDGNTDEELCNQWMQLAAFKAVLFAIRYRGCNLPGTFPLGQCCCCIKKRHSRSLFSAT
ncbi:hypothetical protein F5146DRAFT_145262 [Armillaria mellea]|nr:hypothetical protein F5146DRAFT_145262 [Armillaria mellea]